MIPNNNFSVLPWYTSLDQQNARKWWTYDRVYPLFTQAGHLLPWQLLTPYNASVQISSINRILLFDGNTGEQLGNYTDLLRPFISLEKYEAIGVNAFIFGGQAMAFPSMSDGRYYLSIRIGSTTYYSEVFTVIQDTSSYLKIEWWDDEDFVMDAGIIVYKYANGTQFRNELYLCADIGKPEYIFEEEGKTRDGYFFPIKQISEKRYRFNFLASEYLLDVMRFIRMADYAQIIKNGQTYTLDTFLLTPEWEDNGDVASVEAEFDTATVAKKIGLGYIKTQRGDFNDDFNNDFDNQ